MGQIIQRTLIQICFDSFYNFILSQQIGLSFSVEQFADVIRDIAEISFSWTEIVL